LYLERGESFVEELNGAFSIAIWDERSQELILVNDRLGFSPIYTASYQNKFSFASRLGALMADPTLPKELDFTSLGQFLTLDHVLGTSTYLNNVSLLPPASILTIRRDGIVSTQTYWGTEFLELLPKKNENDYLEELDFLLRQAVSRQKPDQPSGILLSGGLDSRVILAYLQNVTGGFPIYAFTMGSQECDDVRYARALARHCGIEHYFYPLEPKYLIEKARTGVQITDGMNNVVHMHALAHLDAQAQKAKIIYKGFLGDALMGYFSSRDFLANYAPEDLFQIFLERYPILFDFSEHQNLFSKEFLAQQNLSISDSIRNFILDDCLSCGSAADFFFKFDLQQRQRRLTLNGLRLVRSQAVVRGPFYDNDLLDFMLRLPQGYRLDRYLLKKVFVRKFPELAKIPTTENNLPMIECRQKLWLEFERQIRWRLRSAGLNWVSPPTKIPYASYNQWFRGILGQWAADILLSDRFTQRGYFNQAYVQKILDEHKAGKNHYKRLGALISFELWQQQFIDTGSST
jgi:asparagine synthase (glutamine-hydrolysing)